MPLWQEAVRGEAAGAGRWAGAARGWAGAIAGLGAGLAGAGGASWADAADERARDVAKAAMKVRIPSDEGNIDFTGKRV
jgi:hypothetical protein